MILRDQEVSGSVVVVICGDDGARIFQLNLIETDIGGDVFETVGPEVAEEANFALAVFRFAGGDQVDPSVIVIVEGGDTVRAQTNLSAEERLVRAICLYCCARE